MPANGLVQTRINSIFKAEDAAVLATMGLTVSDAVRLLLTRVAQDKMLPFEPLIPNATTIAAVQEARSGYLKSNPNFRALLDDLGSGPVKSLA